MSQETFDDKLKRVFVDPKVQAAVVDQVIRKKPKGWGRHSNAPYYSEVYGKQLQVVVDAMMIDRQPRCYFYDEYLKKHGVSKETLYLRVNQSRLWLLEQMDPDGRYTKFFSLVEIHRERGVGVIIRYKPEFQDGDDSDFAPRTVLPVNEMPRWKKEVDEFLENASAGDKKHIDKLALSPDDILQLKIQLAGLKDVISNITAFEIKLVKINLE